MLPMYMPGRITMPHVHLRKSFRREDPMGITIVQKSDLTHPKSHPKTALVLSGGAISGGAFKLGGLQALSSFMLNRKITEFDIYVGVSAGSLLATFLANGISTEELVKSMEGKRGCIDPIPLSAIYSPNYLEFFKNPIQTFGSTITWVPRFVLNFVAANNLFRREFRSVTFDFLTHPSYENLQRLCRYSLMKSDSGTRIPELLWKLLPTGFFSTDRFERSIRRNLERNKLCNDFATLHRERKKALYIIAMNLNSAQREVFGYDETSHVPLSKAMQASIALPVFYQPVRIDNADYVDGAVVKTTSIDLAIEKGADLIICYNPFRPFNQEAFCERCEEGESHLDISRDGVYAVFNQVMRTLLHTRLMHGVDLYRKSPGFKGDIIIIEPTEYDAEFFDMNPMAFWGRRKAAKRGFQSVKASIRENYPMLKKILTAYGIKINKGFFQGEPTGSDAAVRPLPSVKSLKENPLRP